MPEGICKPCVGRIPKVVGRYVNIYKPQADRYTLPNATSGAMTYVQGQTYQDWRTNDHSFIKGPDGAWHCFGITRPWVSGDNGHSGEGLCFHAVAPVGTFDQVVAFQAWRDVEKIQVGDCGWAPAVVRVGQRYALIGSHLGCAMSDDLYAWTDQGRLDIQGGDRDPHVMLWNGVYHLVRCDGNGVNLVTSTDFLHWTDPVTIFRPAIASHQTESPVLIPYDGRFYLFWTLWDTEDLTTSGYCPRTFVHCSDTPTDFQGRPAIAEFMAHAPEIIQGESGAWYLSSADYPHRGVSMAQLAWV
jgi:beta-fructofuranosidase